ncbi:MAG: Glycerol kinase [Bacteroidetes bacterium ADurb.Bin408]|nr:MAG: Glycerol kinase [Bacteroidetes bacterium ADurb.Bin408]
MRSKTVKKYILSLDVGTTSTRAILFDSDFNICGISQYEITQHYSGNACVEQSPDELFNLTMKAAEELLNKNNLTTADVAVIGITNQRETTIVWDKISGNPVYNAIVWQDKRTAATCQALKKEGKSKTILLKTGLQIDPYFSATKIQWILDHVKGARRKAEKGELLFGTVDTWLIWKMTGGRVHATDVSNASRTMIFNINTLQWDDELLALFNIPYNMLPQIKASAGITAYTSGEIFNGAAIPVAGVAGDHQAALFGQCCFEKGRVKNTYGTGCFMLMNCGNKPVISKHGLLTTVAWKIGDKVTYALEGSVFIAGSAIKWLRDELNIIASANETELYAQSLNDTSGVYFVPCFSGLGAPFWDMEARGIITGLSLGTTKAHIIKATLDSLAYQSGDLIEAMQKDSGSKVRQLHVDGGASVNNYLMQFQADILNTEVVRPAITESTALGAAMLAAIGVGIHTPETLMRRYKTDRTFKPSMSPAARKKLLKGWRNAVKRAKSLETD